MQGNKLLLAGWLSVAVFCLLQIVFGPGGQLAMARLKDYEKKLDHRLSQLQDDNTRLMNRYLALRTSAEEVRLEARRLGYFSREEIPVKVLSGPDFTLDRMTTGDLTVIPPLGPQEDLDNFFRAAWVLLFLIFYLLLLFIDKLRNPSQGRSDPVPLGKSLTVMPEDDPLWSGLKSEENLAPKLPVIQDFRQFK